MWIASLPSSQFFLGAEIEEGSISALTRFIKNWEHRIYKVQVSHYEPLVDRIGTVYGTKKLQRITKLEIRAEACL